MEVKKSQIITGAPKTPIASSTSLISPKSKTDAWQENVIILLTEILDVQKKTLLSLQEEDIPEEEKDLSENEDEEVLPEVPLKKKSKA